MHVRAVLVRSTALILVSGAFLVGVSAPASATTLAVSKTADTNDGVCDADCSLREAISAANANPGPDTVLVPAGTYTLTIPNAGGTNEDGNATGDLDVTGSLSLQKVGAGTVVIQAGTNDTNGIDKVLALNPVCTSPMDVTIDHVTIRYGRNTQPANAPDFSHTGGGIDWCATGSGSVFTLSNSVVSDNTNVNGYGGGLNVDSASATGFTVNLTNDTFSTNKTQSATNTATGGAVNLYGSGLDVNITNSSFTGNTTGGTTSGGGAIYFRPTTASSLDISGSSFSSNTAAGIGGAIATNTFGAGTTVSIQGSSFTGNTATNSFGGALDLDSSNLNTTPFSLSHLTLTGNTAGISGGAVYVGNSNVNLSKSLIVGNNAPDGSGLHRSVDAGTVTATNNWWGCSTGPGAAPCDTATTSGGTLGFTPWYRNQLTAATSPVVVNQSTGLTASFLTNSANAAVPAGDLAELVGRSVTWAATKGDLSSTQGTVQAAGTATGSFQATSVGTAVISAKVDHDNTAPTSSNVLSLTVGKADTTAVITNSASLTSTNSVTGEPVTVDFGVTGAFGNSPTAPTGNVTVSDGTNSCTASVAAGTCDIVLTSAGSKSLTATYAGDSNFNADASPSVAHTVDKADTTTSITSDNPDPSVTGQSVTVHYGVAVTSPGAGTPTGSVTVSDGTQSCSASVAAGQCTISFTSASAKSLTATYAGDSNFNGSTSSTEAHTVDKADTSTSITSDNPDPSTPGQNVTVGYTVTATSPGAGTPTGNVTVSDGTQSCTATVAAGHCTIAFTGGGLRSLTATYAGDGDFNGSTSPTESHTVSKTDTSTSITSDSPDPSVTGQSVTVHYDVTAVGGGTPTGSVTVSDGTQSCTATVAAGQCTIAFSTTGAKSLTASYAGDSDFKASDSSTEAHTVDKADTSTSITSDGPDPSVTGQSVTVHYDVAATAPGGGNPTGSVTVSDGTQSCTATVAAGQCTIAFTSAGARSMTASYAGSSDYTSSTSTTEAHAVDKADTTTTITSDNPDPSVSGQTVTVQYDVGATAPGAGTPTGSVTVSDGTQSCTATVAAGQCTIAFTSPGARSLTATYAGDSDFNGSTSAAEAHSVDKVGTTTSITSDSPDPSVTGQSVTVDFTVASLGGGTPTGTVTVGDGTQSCSASVATGHCTIAFTSTGAKSLTASYAGDSDFKASDSSAEAHTVGKADTTTTITSDSPDPSVTGQSVTVHYDVAATAPGGGNPTGSVTVSDGTQSCTASVAAGQCTIAFNGAGARSLTATYAGDGDFNGSTSSAEAHGVGKADTTTSITSDGPDPSVAGQTVTVHYDVSVTSPGAGTPTGTVTVSDGTQSCTGTVAAGQCAISFTGAGARSLTATYAGNSDFKASDSSAEAHAVDKADTTTSITSDGPDPSVTGQSVTVHYGVAVTAPGGGTPTGSVTVSDGTQSCTASVAAGQCSIAFSSAGARSLTATYAGNGDFSGSTSTTEAHAVDKADTTTAITADSPDPSGPGQTVTVSYSVTATSPGAGTPTGTVTVSDGTQSCSATVAAGQCTLAFSSPGPRSLTASYAGDGDFKASTSPAEAHSVGKIDTTTTITSDGPDPSVTGQPVVVRFEVTAVGGGTPTGTVTVSDGPQSCSATVAAGQCTIAFAGAGARSLAATYGGDSDFKASDSSTEAHTVDRADTTTTITSDGPDPSVSGEPVTVHYAVAVTSPGAGTPTGTVTVGDGVDQCSASVAAGSCTLTLTTPGARTLTASYGGDSDLRGSTSAGEPHHVSALVAPDPPTDVTATAGNASATVSWTAPADPGSRPVTGYDVQYSADSGATWTSGSPAFHGSTATEQVVDGLTNGTSYLFRVAAISDVGTGAYSAPSTAVTPEGDGTSLTVRAPRKIRYGASATIVTSLRDATTDAPIGGATVLLYRRAGASLPWSPVATRTTSSTGAATASVRPSARMHYQWRYAGDDTRASSTSPVATVSVAQVVLVHRSRPTAEVYGTVRPAGAGRHVFLQRRVGGSWKDVASTVIRRQQLPDGVRTVGYVFDVEHRGRYRVRIPATPTLLEGRSRPVRIS